MQRLIRFLRLPSGRGLLLEAMFWLAVSEPVVRLVPFRRLARWLGKPNAQTEETLPRHQSDAARQIAWAIRTATYHLPWRNRCLSQALTARAMLRRRRIPCTLYLGVAREGPDRISAHAWLRCGSRILTGGPGRGRFSVISTFADPEEVS